MQLYESSCCIVPFAASVVVWMQKVVVFQIFTQLGEQRFLHYLGEDRQEGDWTVGGAG